jgi:predicted DCC family thiol-disulfide oxidoreductase YuxK
LTVYFDGSCPLCRAEISHYRRQDGTGTISFLDVSSSECALEPGLTRSQAMQRFHVRRSDGSMVSGAAAFVAVWSVLPRWRRLAHLASRPCVLRLLEAAYRLFLLMRPMVSKVFGWLQRPRTARPRVITR